MAGPNLPVNIDTTYTDSPTDASRKTHQQHHDTIHAWLNRLGAFDVIDVVADHGADKTGSTSAATAFNNALAAANTASGKVVVWIPPGLYDVTAGLSTAIINSHVFIRGAGMGVTMLKGQTGTLFTFGDGTTSMSSGGVSDMYLWYPSPDSSSKVIQVNGASSSQTFEHLYLDNVRQLAKLGTVGANGFASSPKFSHIIGATDPAAGSIVIDAVQGSALFLDTVVLTAKGVGFPTGSDPHPANDTTFIRLGQDSWDTVHAFGVLTNRYNRGLNIDAAAATSVSNMWWTDCVFDYCKTNGIKITLGAGANVRSLFFNSGWAVASDGYGVEISGSNGLVKHIHFTDVVSRQSGKCNWRLTHTAMEDVQLTNCMGIGANRLTGNTGSDQDDVVILAAGVTVRGGQFGESSTSYGGTGQGRYGLNLAADLTSLVITNVVADGATDGFVVNANTTASARRVIKDNVKAGGLANYATTGTVTPAASTVTVNHTLPHYATLYIYGGTVTVITHNGATVGTTGPATLNLRPGDTWALTYSVVPTVKQIVWA